MHSRDGRQGCGIGFNVSVSGRDLPKVLGFVSNNSASKADLGGGAMATSKWSGHMGKREKRERERDILLVDFIFT